MFSTERLESFPQEIDVRAPPSMTCKRLVRAHSRDFKAEFLHEDDEERKPRLKATRKKRLFFFTSSTNILARTDGKVGVPSAVVKEVFEQRKCLLSFPIESHCSAALEHLGTIQNMIWVKTSLSSPVHHQLDTILWCSLWFFSTTLEKFCAFPPAAAGDTWTQQFGYKKWISSALPIDLSTSPSLLQESAEEEESSRKDVLDRA